MTQLANIHGKSGKLRRSYQLGSLPIGSVPLVCTISSLSKARRFKRRFKRAAAAMLLLAAMVPLRTFADSIYVTYLAAKSELPTTAQLTGGTTTSVTGTETFDTRTLSATGSGAPFSATFGAGSPITGNFTGSFGILAADQYGGAGGTGRYLATNNSTGLSMKFTTTAAVPGVNYFGLAISALDVGNNMDVLRGGVRLISFNTATLQKALKACPNASNLYCGNPTTAANAGEQYAFINIFDLSGYFDEIRISEASGGSFESDNFTVGFRQANSLFGTDVSVPEPASALLLLPGLAGLALLRRRATALRCWRGLHYSPA